MGGDVITHAVQGLISAVTPGGHHAQRCALCLRTAALCSWE